MAAFGFAACNTGGDDTTCPDVIENPEGISIETVTLNKNRLVLREGTSEALTATVTPHAVRDTTVVWTTSDSAIATVDAMVATVGHESASCVVVVADVVEEGTLGTVNYTLLESENLYYLTLSGTGELPEVEGDADGRPTNRPWWLNGYRNKLTQVTVEEGITAFGDYEFANFSNIDTFEIPSTVTKIGEGCFMECYALKTISIPAGVTTIADGTFSNCAALTKVTLPEGVAKIGSNAFFYCAALTEITLPASLKTMGMGIFEGCMSLTTVNNFPSLIAIPENTFVNCAALVQFTIPSSVKIIEQAAFANCENLTKVTLPTGLYLIENNAFEGCKKLTQITFPENLKGIGYGAFDTPGLKATFLGTTPPQYSGGFYGDYDQIIVPAGSEDAYLQAGWFDDFSFYPGLDAYTPSDATITATEVTVYDGDVLKERLGVDYWYGDFEDSYRVRFAPTLSEGASYAMVIYVPGSLDLSSLNNSQIVRLIRNEGDYVSEGSFQHLSLPKEESKWTAYTVAFTYDDQAGEEMPGAIHETVIEPAKMTLAAPEEFIEFFNEIHAPYTPVADLAISDAEIEVYDGDVLRAESGRSEAFFPHYTYLKGSYLVAYTPVLPASHDTWGFFGSTMDLSAQTNTLLINSMWQIYGRTTHYFTIPKEDNVGVLYTYAVADRYGNEGYEFGDVFTKSIDLRNVTLLSGSLLF